MAKNVCITRIENLLKESSFTGVKKDEIMNSLKQAMAERRVNRIDEINVDAIAKDVSAQIKAQKIIDRANALNDEIIRRKKTQFIIDNYQGVEEEGLMATIVGSNELRPGARDSVAVAQDTVQANLVNSFKQKVREAKLDKLFTEADLPTQSRLASVMEEAGAQQTDIEKRTGIKPPITETNPDIKKLGIIMEEHSEAVRVMLNDRGANIPKIWGWVVKHNHDQFNVRAATETLGMKLSDVKADVNLKGTDENYNKNFKSWKNFTSKYLDERTFDTVDDKEDFFVDVYNSLVGNKIQLAEGANNIFGSRNITKAAGGKRVLHFKSAKDWFTYHQKFGHGNLQETFLSGLMTAGRNIGMMDKLGSNPKANFDKIRIAVYNHVKKSGRDSSKLASNEYFKKFYMQIDGSNYTVENFSLAKYGSIIRMVQNITKLGGAAISAFTDIGIYGSEMKDQGGKTLLGGMGDAFTALGRIKNTKQKTEFAEMSGLMVDGAIHDLAGRNQVGDSLSRGATQIQKTFFKFNLLQWWTNTLKESAMLGMSNYYARQKNLPYDKLNKQLKLLFTKFNIDSTKWDVIRKNAMLKADDGMEFINIGSLDKISDADVKRITGIDNLTKREAKIEKEKFKYSISGMLLDRTLFAVIQPDARVKGIMKQGTLAGTPIGEAVSFLGQFKGFPVAIFNKIIGRDIAYMRAGPNQDIGRGARGIAATIVTSALLGYASMTIKDLLKGRSPRDPAKWNTVMASLLQGGGLGLYGDVLFREQRDGSTIIAGLAGPGATTVADVLLAINYGIRGEGGKAGKAAYRAVNANIPFMNLFYIKTVYDYLIGYNMMETMSPGALKRVERRMKKEYNQEYLLTKPSSMFKGF
jgi:hypothetical protein